MKSLETAPKAAQEVSGMWDSTGLCIEGFRLSVAEDPWFCTRFPSEYSIKELDSFLRELDRFFVDRGFEPFSLMVDVSIVRRTNALTRKRLAEFFGKWGTYFDDHCTAMAIVTATALQQGAITAVFWFRPNSWPTKVFSSKHAAAQWLTEQLSDEGSRDLLGASS